METEKYTTTCIVCADVARRGEILRINSRLSSLSSKVTNQHKTYELVKEQIMLLNI